MENGASKWRRPLLVRDHLGGFIGGFSSHIHIHSAFFFLRSCPSSLPWRQLSVKAGISSRLRIHPLVPWSLRIRCENCLIFCKDIVSVFFSYLQERKLCADKLANFRVLSKVALLGGILSPFFLLGMSILGIEIVFLISGLCKVPMDFGLVPSFCSSFFLLLLMLFSMWLMDRSSEGVNPVGILSLFLLPHHQFY